MRINNLTIEQRKTRKMILEISHICKFSHLGSCLSAVDLIDAVYQVKDRDEKFILSNGHAAVALYAILEKNGLLKRAAILKLNVHPNRNPKLSIDVSTGSLGHGLPIAVGMALANRNKNVYCIISDGELSEGSIWESFRVISEQKLINLKLLLNANGWGAYDPIPLGNLPYKFKSFGLQVKIVDGHNLNKIKSALRMEVKKKPILIFAKTTVNQLPFLKDQDAHYYIMKNEDYDLAMKLLQ